MDDTNVTIAGTNVGKVKWLNENSGLTYNEVKEQIAKTGGMGTAAYSDTDPEEVRQNIRGE